MSSRSPAAFRALTTSAFTGALAVAAHALAGGGWPVGGATVLLAVTCAAVGLIALADRAAGTPTLVALLAGGQLAAHLSLAAAGHTHAETAGLSTSSMLLPHAVAVLVGAALVSAAQRLCAALSGAVRRYLRWTHPLIPFRPTAMVVGTAQPLQHVLLLAASTTQRGPPARVQM